MTYAIWDSPAFSYCTFPEPVRPNVASKIAVCCLIVSDPSPLPARADDVPASFWMEHQWNESNWAPTVEDRHVYRVSELRGK